MAKVTLDSTTAPFVFGMSRSSERLGQLVTRSRMPLSSILFGASCDNSNTASRGSRPNGVKASDVKVPAVLKVVRIVSIYRVVKALHTQTNEYSER